MSSKQNLSVKEQLKGYYETAKEKLLKMKEEVKVSEENYAAAKEENAQRILEYNETLEESKKLDLILKGLQEKLILERKRKSSLENLIKKYTEDTSSSETGLEILSKETEKKVTRVKNDNKYVQTLEKRQVEEIENAITRALEINNELRQNISDIEQRIDEVAQEIGYVHSVEGKKTDMLLKDTAEMNKFLSEL